MLRRVFMAGGVALLAVALALTGAPAFAQPAQPPGTIDVGKTGWDVKRPVFASACPQGCPWGELGEFMQEAMKPLGYEVILCRNCNRERGPRLVGMASPPPPLDAIDAMSGTKQRVNAAPDFGVTAAGMLAQAYAVQGPYAKDGLRNLRLIAKIEDPMYLLVAVKASSGITDLAQIAQRKMPVKILAGPSAGPVLAHFGLTRELVQSWGGAFANSMHAGKAVEFDVIIDDLGSPAMNPESSQWTELSQHHDLKFLELPEALLAKLDAEPDYERVTVRWGLVKGVDRNFQTVGRSGEAVFARADTPEQVAYEIAKAIDQNRGKLKWFIRPYSYDPRTVTENQGVPLHVGAARYYREAGYLK